MKEKLNDKNKNKGLFIFLGILGLIIILFILIPSSTQDNKKNLNAEITSLDQKYFYTIINRDSFEWTNVSITIDDYYTCWEFDNILPNEERRIYASDCDDFIVRHNMVSKIEVNSNEGTALFGRQ